MCMHILTTVQCIALSIKGLYHSRALYLIYAGGRMERVAQSAALPSLLAAPTLATSCVLSWTATAAARVNTATTSAEAKFPKVVVQ